MVKKFRCINCNKDKTPDNFYPDKDRDDGVSLFCLDCVGELVGKEHKRERKRSCKTCFGYGVFAYDGEPLPIKAVRAHYPSKSCPECGANWSTGKPSKYNQNSLSRLLVFWKGKQTVSLTRQKG